MRKIVFFMGPAGAGKTTLSKALTRRTKAPLFDMDTLTRPVAAAMMTLAGLDPEDRDSIAYKTLCRDLGYRITMDGALENVALGLDAYVVGPFTQESESHAWLEGELARIHATLQDVTIKVIFVHLDGKDCYYKRIEGRKMPSDQWKLSHWQEFSQSLQIREIKWKLPPSSILYFNNSQGISDTDLENLASFIDSY